jgi:ATP-binding cassette subfamily B protein
MIGAAAVKNPLLMVIDEATSSLDAKTERKVQHGLETALANCGALIVTHRLSTVRNICDKFIMMEQINGGGGQITAIAKSFEELALKSSLFRELAEEQGIYLKTS